MATDVYLFLPSLPDGANYYREVLPYGQIEMKPSNTPEGV